MSTRKFAICAGCSCLCDDIPLVPGGHPDCSGCLPGRDWFAKPDAPAVCFVDGHETSLEEAVEQAAANLTAADSPLVTGLDGLSNQAQIRAFELGVLCGGFLDSGFDDSGRASMVAMQQTGMVTATLGEVSTRSKTVLFWNADPRESHPRLIERYCQSADQFIFVGDLNTPLPGRLEGRPTMHIPLNTDREIAALNLLTAFASEIEPDGESVLQSTGRSLAVWQSLFAAITAENYTAIFAGGSGADFHIRVAARQLLFRLVQRLNRDRRMVVLNLSRNHNSGSAEQVIGAGTGFPFAVRFGTKIEYDPLRYSTRAILDRGDCDAILVCSTVQAEPDSISTVPAAIVLTDDPLRWSGHAQVVIGTSVCGKSDHGDWYRMDGVPLLMQPVGSAIGGSTDGSASGPDDATGVPPRAVDVLGEIQRRMRRG